MRLAFSKGVSVPRLQFAVVVAFLVSARLASSGAEADRRDRSPLPADLDADGDGLLDAEEDALARTYAPLVLLHKDEPNYPAAIEWALARVRMPWVRQPRRLSRSWALARVRMPFSGRDAQAKSAEFTPAVRAGDRSRRDWPVYAHVYPRADGGIDLQYWFYYPYNTGFLVFDHDSDWEHVTVSLDGGRRPTGAAFARHGNNSPGPFRPWAELRRLGTHPVVLSARGSHASYFDAGEVPFYDRVTDCADVAGRCPGVSWRTWLNVVNVGESGAPREGGAFLAFAGPWGSGGSLIPGTDAPPGPSHQRGWCEAGLPGCGPSVIEASR